MAANLATLTKDWIQYLKNNQIVDMQSDSKTGRLKYKREPSVDEFIKFLNLYTDFDQTDINAALRSVLSNRQPPTEKSPQLVSPPEDDKQNSGPAALRGPESLSEALNDRSVHKIGEDDIEKIFDILLRSKSNSPAPPDQKQEFMRQLKEIVRNTMTPQQRKALWRALGDENLSEATINRADIGAIFKDAAYLRTKPSKLGKIFKRYRKDKISVDDLQKAWADGLDPDGSDGYSDDTNDIKRILQQFGFGDAEIKKVFGRVFNTDNTEYDDVQSAPAGAKTVQKIADFAKSKGIDKALKSFLEQEFGEDLGLGKKVTYEDVKNIFTFIVNEERTDRIRLMKEEETRQLGRSKK